MFRLSHMRRTVTLAFLTTLLIAIGSIRAADLDPKAINIQLPKDIKWSGSSTSPNQQAVLVGDPTKEGLYVVLRR